MDKEYKMTQCLLQRGNESKVAWIPSSKANLNKVRIDGIPGVWTVKERYATDLSSNVIENSSDYRRHREATDI